jgi:hypothetical protein
MQKIPIFDSQKRIVKIVGKSGFERRASGWPDTAKTALVIIGAFCCT